MQLLDPLLAITNVAKKQYYIYNVI